MVLIIAFVSTDCKAMDVGVVKLVIAWHLNLYYYAFEEIILENVVTHYKSINCSIGTRLYPYGTQFGQPWFGGTDQGYAYLYVPEGIYFVRSLYQRLYVREYCHLILS